MCAYCADIETLEHLLLHCPAFGVERGDLRDSYRLYALPANSLKDLLFPDAHSSLVKRVTSSSLFSSLEFVGVSGPTWDDQPPFQWSTSGFEDGHVGQPDRWQFEPVHRKWAQPRVQWRSEL
ncbi:hypothetical protein HPB49_008810 [Dermacentor silvarum]|uniref:Uncharacterized protein n=1 Tax=Dermacentor silvarum TaxID=543639 RepID=A0ACB8DYT3_DERSI|nr:hypothetical protein HPB49_008810 [Dermacentor silvarum]